MSGWSGISGYSGSGISGYSGSGISGYSGFSGISGYSGSGVSGYSGLSGYSGTSGYSSNASILSRGATLYNSTGLTTAMNIIAWYAPFSCTVSNVRGYRVSGTGATINARKNGTSNHLSSNLSLTSTDTWMDGGSVQNTSYISGDKLEIMMTSAAGNPQQVAVQVDFTRP
jgi:hypothetical protein